MTWRRTTLLAAFIVALPWGAATAEAQRCVLVVRHAERLDDSADSPLSAAGEERASRLATLLRDAGVTAIFATEWRRTQQTAAPLAARLGIEVSQTPSRDVAALVERLRSRHADDTVLVVGHSDTVPQILTSLGSALSLSIARDEYDNLLVVVPRPGQPPLVTRLRY